MGKLAQRPVIVLSPHLDDAVYSAWAVISQPGHVRVVNVCTALPEPGMCPRWDRVVGATDSAALMRLRLGEDLEALALAGRRPLNLGFLDAQYRDGRPLGRDALRAALEPELRQASAVYAPAGLGGHPDHVAVRDVAVSTALPTGIPVFLYAELPYATRFGWPHWVTGQPERPELRPEAAWADYLATVPCGAETLSPRVAALSAAEAELKLRAMEAYGTQFTALNGGPLDLLRNPLVRSFEVFWECSGDTGGRLTGSAPAVRTPTPRRGGAGSSQAGR